MVSLSPSIKLLSSSVPHPAIIKDTMSNALIILLMISSLRFLRKCLPSFPFLFTSWHVLLPVHFFKGISAIGFQNRCINLGCFNGGVSKLLLYKAVVVIAGLQQEGGVCMSHAMDGVVGRKVCLSGDGLEHLLQ